MLSTCIRILLFIGGWISLALGVIGIVTPILPTTPFILLAAACFSRSSTRFHAWLLNNRLFGPIIHNWQQNRCIDAVIKRRALIVMAITFVLSISLTPMLMVKLGLVGVWLTCSFFVYRLPENRLAETIEK